MISIHYFTFGPMGENTYILWDETKECVIIDPGNYNHTENKQLSDFVTKNGLKPVRLLLTHGHIDHINGNRYVLDTYNLLPEMHQDDIYFIEHHLISANMYGLKVEQSPMPKVLLNEGDTVTFGNSTLEIVHTPGHSPGSITFFNKTDKFMISGDVLFYACIGRADLPMGNYETLIKSIKQKLLPLGDEMTVYSGHGQETTIGSERMYNTFLV
jgi:glyoxylase-like metal-dependent hydrolase (beta-lactamase superfamily II)